MRSVFLETLLTAELHWNVKSRVNLTVYQQAVEGHAAGHFLYLQPLQSTRHAFILFSHMDRQSFLAHDGIQTLDMLSLGFGPNKDRFSS